MFYSYIGTIFTEQLSAPGAHVALACAGTSPGTNVEACRTSCRGQAPPCGPGP